MSKHHYPNIHVDHWVCPYCGTSFGPDQAECPDLDCIAQRERDAEEAMVDDRVQRVKDALLDQEYIDSIEGEFLKQ